MLIAAGRVGLFVKVEFLEPIFDRVRIGRALIDNALPNFLECFAAPSAARAGSKALRQLCRLPNSLHPSKINDLAETNMKAQA